ncbi:MAG TPA: three-Cys-motif partner protein TcmP [Ignavibacteria bacterium]|nr:three-Cys-motif partner protein TcmP [Ignavibacteria bacterium]
MSKEFHNKEFYEGTLFKLSILEGYFKEWLPVFTVTKFADYPQINIFDFFAGPGRDVKGNKGSPLIFIENINKYKDLILKNEIKINLFLNELNKNKYNLLLKNVKTEINNLFKVEILNSDFFKLFNEINKTFDKSINFIFLDQCGVRFVSEEIFKEIIKLPKTDFLFFISSSYFKRFKDDPNFKKYLGINPDSIKQSDYYKIHNEIFNYYKSLISINTKYFLSKFSIKKGANIYGLIFGTNHPLGMEKFLKICWEKDKITGEANFDIHRENISLEQPSLFSEHNKSQKIKIFEDEIKTKIVAGELKTDVEVLLYALENGFLAQHYKDVTKQLVKEGKIEKITFKSNCKKIKDYTPQAIKVK